MFCCWKRQTLGVLFCILQFQYFWKYLVITNAIYDYNLFSLPVSIFSSQTSLNIKQNILCIAAAQYCKQNVLCFNISNSNGTYIAVSIFPSQVENMIISNGIRLLQHLQAKLKYHMVFRYIAYSTFPTQVANMKISNGLFLLQHLQAKLKIWKCNLQQTGAALSTSTSSKPRHLARLITQPDDLCYLYVFGFLRWSSVFPLPDTKKYR